MQNGIVDAISRTVWDNHSYSPHQPIFDATKASQGPFEIDPFADFSTYKVQRYFSCLKDPFARRIDALSHRLVGTRGVTFERFPPF